MRGRGRPAKRSWYSSVSRDLAVGQKRQRKRTSSIIRSEILVAPDKLAPRPIPGKTYMLLPCPAQWTLPLTSMGEKGDPEAKTTLPFVLQCSIVIVESVDRVKGQ